MAISTSLRADPLIGPRARRVLVAIGAVTLVVLLFGASRSSVFRARSVEVTGAHHVGTERILGIADVSTRTNALWLDEGAVERRLQAMPWVAHAEVGVAFPLTVEIRIVEREPVAVARDGSGLVLMARDGTALERVARRGDLPMIEVGVGGRVDGIRSDPVGAARALGAMPDELRERVGRVRVLLGGSLELWLRDGPRVLFGAPTDAHRKARAIVRVLAWAEGEGASIRLVSVAEPSRPAVRLA